MTTVDDKNVASTKDMNVVNETSKANAQAETVNAKKDVANEVLGSALKNIVPGWVKDLITNPIVPAVAVGLLTASPVAALGTFGVGTLSKTLAKINENTSGKATYKDATISDKNIVLNKDGTWAYTGENIVKTSSNLPFSTTFGPGGTNTVLEKGSPFYEPTGPVARLPQAPPTLDEKKKEEPKKEEPKKEESKVEPKKEEPKKEEPKKEEPKKEEPKKEESKKEEPKKEESKKEEPKVEVVAEKTVTIPQPMGAVEPKVPENHKVPENQPTVEIPAPMNNGPVETAQPSSGDVIVTKPRVIHVGESDKDDVDKEAQATEKSHESDPNVGIWEGRDDIDKNDTKNNSGGDYSSNSDNKSISPEYQALLDSLDSTPDVSDGPDF